MISDNVGLREKMPYAVLATPPGVNRRGGIFGPLIITPGVRSDFLAHSREATADVRGLPDYMRRLFYRFCKVGLQRR